MQTTTNRTPATPVFALALLCAAPGNNRVWHVAHCPYCHQPHTHIALQNLWYEDGYGVNLRLDGFDDVREETAPCNGEQYILITPAGSVAEVWPGLGKDADVPFPDDLW